MHVLMRLQMLSHVWLSPVLEVVDSASAFHGSASITTRTRKFQDGGKKIIGSAYFLLVKFLPLCQVLGTMASDRSSYFPDNVLEPIFTAEPVAVPKFPEIYVGIDPASHNSSSMGLSAIGVKDGTVFLMGLASVKIERADVREVSQSITVFLERLREHPAIGDKSSFLPIVEVRPFVFEWVVVFLCSGIGKRERAIRTISCQFFCRVSAVS